ncbi:MAG: hypothetical protein NTX17_04975 [Candidatus Eisenbacteria bacterium]|nr:hypothetical protein [Candidatus Eisenbacteria bacterium]
MSGTLQNTPIQPHRDQEYTEANLYLRHYSSLRFVMVSVYFAVSAAAVSAAFGLISPEKGVTHSVLIAFRVIGLGVTFVFFGYERRLEQLIRYYQEKARELERLLQYNTMEERPRSNLMFRATKGLYIMFMVFWFLSLALIGNV